nr:MAG TPA: hypothetical protein [Caudoviricetes sp.]
MRALSCSTVPARLAAFSRLSLFLFSPHLVGTPPFFARRAYSINGHVVYLF